MKVYFAILLCTIFIYLGACREEKSHYKTRSSLVKIINIRLNLDSVFNSGDSVLKDSGTLELADVQLIQLKAKDTLIHPNVQKIIFWKDLIYCFDISINPSVTIFDSSGNLKRVIKGKSGEKYYFDRLVDGNIDENNGNVLLVGNKKNSWLNLLQFDSSGTFINSTRTKYNGKLSFMPVNGKFYFYLSTGDAKGIRSLTENKGEIGYRLFSSNNFSFNIEYKELPYLTKYVKSGINTFDNFSKLNEDTTILFENFNDTIYSISSGSVEPRYRISFEGNKTKLPEGFMQDKTIQDKAEFILKNKFPMLISVIENANKVIGFFSHYNIKDNQRFVDYFIYDKKYGGIFGSHNFRLPAKFDGLPFNLNNESMPGFVNQVDGRFVSVINAEFLNNKLKEEERFNKGKGPIHELCKRNNFKNLDSALPILMLFNLK